MRQSVRNAIVIGGFLNAAGCTAVGSHEEEIQTASAALTVQDAVQILGFESASDWSVVAGSATLTTSASHVQGSYSVQLQGGGYTRFISQPISTLPFGSDKMTLSVLIPAEQANPYWFGQVQVFLDSPSLGIYSEFAGQADLNGHAPGEWATLEMTITPGVYTKLISGSFDDLRIMVGLNVPANAPGQYRFDKLALAEVDPCIADAQVGGSVPSLDVSTEPEEDGSIVILPLVAGEAGEVGSGQFSLRLDFHNTGQSAVIINHVTVSFPSGGQPNGNYDLNLCVEAGRTQQWYFDAGDGQAKDNIILNEPLPTVAGFAVSADNYTFPHAFTRPVKVHEAPVPFGTWTWPSYGSDLGPNQYWRGQAATHAPAGGGWQLFGLDLHVADEDGNTKESGATMNEEHYIWDKAIRAMAKGVVTASADGYEDNDPGTKKCFGDSPDPNADCDGITVYGNYVCLLHGDEEVCYAHMREGTVDPTLLVEGTEVTRGQLLGRAGNSGNSDGPHLHIHAVQDGTARLRPMPFREAFAVNVDGNESPDASTPWSYLSAHGLPKPPEVSFIWPTVTHPVTRPIALSIAQPETFAAYFITQEPQPAFLDRISTLRAQGLRMLSATTYLDNGVRRWGGVWGAGSWDEEFIVDLELEAFHDRVQELFDDRDLRLMDVDSYEVGGTRLWSGISRVGTGANWFLSGFSKIGLLTKLAELEAEGLVPVKVIPYDVAGEQKWAFVVSSAEWSVGKVVVDLEQDAFVTEVQRLFDDEGFRLIDGTSYLDNGVRRWVGVLRPATYGLKVAIRTDLRAIGDVIQADFDQSGFRPTHLDITTE